MTVFMIIFIAILVSAIVDIFDGNVLYPNSNYRIFYMW